MWESRINERIVLVFTVSKPGRFHWIAKADVSWNIDDDVVPGGGGSGSGQGDGGGGGPQGGRGGPPMGGRGKGSEG
nr:hypothetical protein [Tanacetum cinerariifolium]